MGTGQVFSAGIPFRGEREILTTREILFAIHKVLDADCDVIEVHSSIPTLSGLKRGTAKWSFLRAIRELVRQGKTLLFPAFTFSYSAGKEFNIHHSPSETGVLADWVLSLPEARRTPNPIFSFVVIGPKSPLFLNADHHDAYGPRSVFAVLEEQNAGALMLGAAWDYLSFLHKMEQQHAVPYREFKTFNILADFGNGPVDPDMRVYVRRRDINTELNFAAAGLTAEAEGVVTSFALGQGEIKFVWLRTIVNICNREMAASPFFLLQEGNRVAADIANLELQQQQQPFRVALLSAENPDYLVEALKKQLAIAAPSRRFVFYANHYGNFYQDLTLNDSSLRDFKPNLTIIADTLESISGKAGRYALDEESHHSRLQRWHSAVSSWMATSDHQVVVFKPVWSISAPADEGVGASSTRYDAQVEELAAQLSAELRQRGGILIDTATLAAEAASPLRDPRTWYLARTPWSPQFARAAANRIAGLILDRCGLSVRLIVVDLDNTLWGGVATDDGIEGVALGGDYPGNAHRDFQLLLKSLSQCGIGLAVASKNDADVAWEIIDRHPEMVLQRDDFVDDEIHWQPKADSIQRIASRLNLGLSNIMFLDDNPIEREAVRRTLPQVIVPELGNEPALYCEVLIKTPGLNRALITENDRHRVQSFKQLKTVATARSSASDAFSFIKELNVTLTFSALSSGNSSRAEQLMTKTNQFNTTIKRYSALDLKSLQDRGYTVTVLEVTDKYNPQEIMGVLVMKDEVVDSIVISCRAFGKGIEQAIFHVLTKQTFERFARALRVEFIKTSKNHIVADILSGLKFTEQDGSWTASADSISVAIPAVTLSGLEELPL
ncbi:MULTISPECIES: HAD-IIIC family phosphatase [Erwinia]|uniref:aminoglycoside N(3)-acetyltransferase n=1 Tax=Erwinia rhapontici TaxID=55212 RepID=A0ABM7N7D2_ERWRD|nr:MULTISPECIES: HAD-IIIC family phosphatase [Erwinia]MCS3609686.1 FkbH-like protein [Erwinia rhapontici]NNS09704.1 HAD-IIIC family phosphatase [Erwinia sp. JH02]BCQ37390.1 hypothetical protein ERHA53_47330 [Erwinia rhapontici]